MSKKISQKYLKFFNKKGQAGTDSSIIQLFYIILGLIVLLTFIKIIMMVLSLNASSNGDISTQNGKSINEFIEFSTSDDYGNLKDCFTTLKLSNLENYQYYDKSSEGLNNYFLIITEDGIYKHEISKKDSFLVTTNSITSNEFGNGQQYNTESPYGLPLPNTDTTTKTTINIKNSKKIISFDKKIIIKHDNTWGGTVKIFTPSTWKNLIHTDQKLDMGEKLQYLVLNPVFSAGNGFSYNDLKSSAGAVFDENIDFFEGQNRFKIKGYDFGGKAYSIYGTNINYVPADNTLFVSANGYSDSLIYENLCSLKHFTNNLKDSIYKKDDGKNIATNNNDITITVFADGIDTGYNFTWAKIFECKKGTQKLSCEKDIGISDSINDYNQFLVKVQDFAQKNIKTKENGELEYRINYRKLSLKEIQEKSKIRPAIFEKVFTNKKSYKTISELRTENPTHFGISLLFLNKYLNGKQNVFSDTIFLDSAKIMFLTEYNKTSKEYNYYEFNSDYLTYKNSPDAKLGTYQELYFNGKKIENGHINTYNADKAGIKFLGGDNKKIYYIGNLKIYKNDKPKIYSVVLSEVQMKLISEVN